MQVGSDQRGGEGRPWVFALRAVRDPGCSVLPADGHLQAHDSASPPIKGRIKVSRACVPGRLEFLSQAVRRAQCQGNKEGGTHLAFWSRARRSDLSFMNSKDG